MVALSVRPCLLFLIMGEWTFTVVLHMRIWVSKNYFTVRELQNLVTYCYSFCKRRRRKKTLLTSFHSTFHSIFPFLTETARGESCSRSRNKLERDAVDTVTLICRRFEPLPFKDMTQVPPASRTCDFSSHSIRIRLYWQIHFIRTCTKARHIRSYIQRNRKCKKETHCPLYRSR